MGDSKEFLKKWEQHVEGYSNKIFMADGAKWIWNFVQDAYPRSVQTLDFFHVIEKLGVNAAARYGDAHYRQQWIEIHKQRLFNNEV